MLDLHQAVALASQLDGNALADHLLEILVAAIGGILGWIAIELRSLRNINAKVGDAVQKLSTYVFGPDGGGGAGSAQHELNLARRRYHDISQTVTEHNFEIQALQVSVTGLEQRERERWGEQ